MPDQFNEPNADDLVQRARNLFERSDEEVSGPRLNGFALFDRQLVETARSRMKESILRHRASPAEESRKLGEALEEVYLQLGMALRRFDDLRDLWGDRLEPR